MDDIDLTDLQPASWQQTVAVIFQDFVRYELSAGDNIAFGSVETLHEADSSQRIASAARRAGADSILNGLPSGLDTPLSRRFQGGTNTFSGGQWQRIALARAMAAVEAGARVLILDEPTAHLDVHTEADMYDRFIISRITTIIISHRFSTVRRASRIVVLDGGRVIEDGSHDQLVAAGGEYARLFYLQAMQYTDAIPKTGPDSEGHDNEWPEMRGAMADHPAPAGPLAASAMLRIAWKIDPRQSLLAIAIFTLEALASTSFALWLKPYLLDGLQAGDARKVLWAALCLAASIAGGAALAYFGNRVRMRLTEQPHHFVERRLIDLMAISPTLEIHETPEHLTQLELLEANGGS